MGELWQSEFLEGNQEGFTDCNSTNTPRTTHQCITGITEQTKSKGYIKSLYPNFGKKHNKKPKYNSSQ